MDKITSVGLDLAKQIIQVHAVDGAGRVVLRKAVRRERLLALLAQFPCCVMGMEACSGAHHWARELVKLGHQPKIMAAEFVRPFRKSLAAKNDANDAEAVCTAMRQPNMRFVAVKTVEQQGLLCLHRVRQGWMEERTALINRLRGLLAEFGVVVPQSATALQRALPTLIAAHEARLPAHAQRCVQELIDHLGALVARIAAFDREIGQHAHGNDAAQRVAALTGIGPITASAIVATLGNASDYRNGRQFAACLGIVATVFQWRQDPTRAHHQARRCLLAHAADPGRAINDAGGAAAAAYPARSHQCLDCATSAARRLSQGVGGDRQQARAGRLGTARARRDIRSQAQRYALTPQQQPNNLPTTAEMSSMR